MIWLNFTTGRLPDVNPPWECFCGGLTATIREFEAILLSDVTPVLQGVHLRWPSLPSKDQREVHKEPLHSSFPQTTQARMLYSSLPVCFLVIGAALCAPERVQSEHDAHDARDLDAHDSSAHEHVAPLEKRSPHYDFGLGKRAYSYVSEYKRLPVYNFGLGKRSRPYSFGLGKRSVEDDPEEQFPLDQDQLNEIFDQYDDAPMYEKRARPYSFGLGKRSDDDPSEDKRARAYDFGLGKRVPLYNFGLGKRARNYNFGLGKRLSSKFNFGLGKRERDMHRFSFGLGKRSAEATDDSEEFDV
ncbi:hypothetical protein NE865_08460 [Phthorimaea operculella]|nr:hypothetical protein NE865_08460 [Phthorimaea operculella]